MQNSQDFSPSVSECYKARETFAQAFQRHSSGNSKEVAIRCALDAVWEAARRYQHQLEALEAAEREYQLLLKESKRMKAVAQNLKEVAV